MAGFGWRSSDLNEAMRPDVPEYFADQMKERPNEKIVVKIRLNNLSDVPKEVMDKLTRLLRSSHNMELSQLTRSKLRTDMVIISGIPPTNGFGEQQVVEIVKKHVKKWSELVVER